MKTKNFKTINIIMCAIVFFGLFFGLAPGIQAKLVSVGVLSFHDESGTGVPWELGSRISRDLQQKLVKSYPGLLPRVIGTGMDAASIKSMTVPQLVSYAKQQGVGFLIRGGLLAISTVNSAGGVKVSIELYAEIISAESNKVRGVRARGVGTQRGTFPLSKVPWEAIDISGSEFQYSAPGLALLNAVEQLAGAVREAVVSPIDESEAAAVPSTPSETETTYDDTQGTDEYQYPTEETQETETEAQTGTDEYQYPSEDDYYSSPEDDYASESGTDEELQQLIYQAEELVYNSSVSSDKLNALSRALETLKESLNSKVTLMEQGEDTSQIDQNIYQQKQKLQQIISEVTEEVSSGEETTEEYQDYETGSGEKKNLLSSIGGYLDDSLNIIEKIKEIRSTLRGARQETQEQEDAGDDEVYSDDSTSESESEYEYETETETEAGTDATTEAETEAAYEEEAAEEVTGVVTEGGEPVEGATVTDPETGVSATTDSSGFYNLGKIPAGRLPELVVSKKGKELARGKVDLAPGRAAVADWELKQRTSRGKKPALRVMPSLVNVGAGKKAAGKVGTVKGVVLDARGKPMRRVLVKLQGLGSARTDSRGQYVFLKVPAGTHLLTVTQSGLNTKSQQVTVRAKKSSVQKIRFTLKDIARKKPALSNFVVRGTASVLWGMVRNEKNRPVNGAKVTVFQSGRAVSVSTQPTGKYTFKDLKPGTYRVLASKVGFKSKAQNVSLKAGKKQKLYFKLEKSSPYIQSILGRQRGKKKKPALIAPKVRPTIIGKGRLTGRIVDSKTKRPLPFAAVSVKGKSTKTDRSGSFTIGGLAPGSYTIVAGKIGYYGQSKRIKVNANKATRKNFALKSKVTSKSGKSTKSRTITKSKTPPRVIAPKTTRVIAVKKGQIKGVIKDAKTRRPIAGATISISRRGSVISGRSGAYAVRNLPPGTYRVSVGKRGYSGKSRTVTVRAGKTSTASFSLTSRSLKKR